MSFGDAATQTLVPDVPRTGAVIGLRAVQTGIEYALEMTCRRWTLGSSEACDIVISDPCVSKTHCALVRRDDGVVVVRDRGSRNGTRVDGNTVEGAELRAGSYLTIGRTTLVATGGHPARRSAIEMLRGRDPVFRATIDRALRSAQLDCNVLIVGETGTGKELLARSVHEGSRRNGAKLVSVNCGGIPRELVASELFGHERGAFTGAVCERDGYFVEADGGTLFLDELGELPAELQPHLLRVLETRHVRRVGGAGERRVDVRIVAATNRIDNLGTEASPIRVDLYHRLATVVLALPPLRERMGDLEELVETYLDELAGDGGRKIVHADAWRALAEYPWPGNVRELLRAVERAVALSSGPELGIEDFFPEVRFGRAPSGVLPPDIGPLLPYESVMRRAMERALEMHGTIRGAAAHLGMAKSTFAEKAKAWGLLPRPRHPTLARVLERRRRNRR